MKIYIVLISVLLFTSCASPEDEGATAVCNCYKELHKVPIEEEPLINFLADSCKTLHIEVLNKINGNEEQKAKFDEAYQYCQQE